ncbi:MAG: hypothetical protein HY326_13000 [Chloroflexi bacterium]|nr:hypothetical protein [Chloroflexota bacterium]
MRFLSRGVGLIAILMVLVAWLVPNIALAGGKGELKPTLGTVVPVTRPLPICQMGQTHYLLDADGGVRYMLRGAADVDLNKFNSRQVRIIGVISAGATSCHDLLTVTEVRELIPNPEKSPSVEPQPINPSH